MENDTFFYSKREITDDNKYKLYSFATCLSIVPMLIDIIYYQHWISLVPEHLMKDVWGFLFAQFALNMVIHWFLAGALLYLNWFLIWIVVKIFNLNLTIKNSKKKKKKKIPDLISNVIIAGSIFLILLINYLAIINITMLKNVADSHDYFITNSEQNFWD